MNAPMVHPRIVQNPSIMTGKPCIAGTRIPVDLILRKLAAGEERDQLLTDYPDLVGEDIDAVLAYAGAPSSSGLRELTLAPPKDDGEESSPLSP